VAIGKRPIATAPKNPANLTALPLAICAGYPIETAGNGYTVSGLFNDSTVLNVNFREIETTGILFANYAFDVSAPILPKAL
jgi:hypothetical protein